VATSNVTQNTISVTQQAQEAFQTAVSDLTSIVSGVLDSNQQLTTTGMVSQAGAKFGSAIAQWTEDFNDMRGTLQWMADQLEAQWKQMVANEQNNTDLAGGLANPAALPGYGSFASS
jgi:uncharacterized protein YaiE (UPF0345 family)